MAELKSLITKLEAAKEGSMGLSREVARAVGWINQGNSRRGEWFAPEDTRDGKPVLDGLRGTDVHREPPDFSRSIDAALTLVPKLADWLLNTQNGEFHAAVYGKSAWQHGRITTPALALCIAALKAQESK